MDEVAVGLVPGCWCDRPGATVKNRSFGLLWCRKSGAKMPATDARNAVYSAPNGWQLRSRLTTRWALCQSLRQPSEQGHCFRLVTSPGGASRGDSMLFSRKHDTTGAAFRA
jgi:hypothetical protein